VIAIACAPHMHRRKRIGYKLGNKIEKSGGGKELKYGRVQI